MLPVEQRGFSSAVMALCSGVAAHAEMSIASNTSDIPVYQGEFTKLSGRIAHGTMHSLVAKGYRISQVRLNSMIVVYLFEPIRWLCL